MVGHPGYRTLAGSADSPVVLHVPHGARRIPAEVREHILLDDAALALELDHMTDAGTDRVAHGAADAVAGDRGPRPWIFENLLSRLVIDPERFPDEREEMRAVGMGAVYTRTSHGEALRADDPAYERELITERFDPYARAMTELIEDRLAATGRAVIIDVHSYPSTALPYELHAADARPEVCLGTDAFHTPDSLLDAARTAFRACGDIALNAPFSGCYVPLRHYRARPEVSALMIEMRRDAYRRDPQALTHALGDLINRCSARGRPG
jgi:N-formylglutamate amidohydrolase